MRTLLVVALLLLCGCEVKTGAVGKETHIPGHDLTRYENDEVVCYIYHSGYGAGLSCKWK